MTEPRKLIRHLTIAAAVCAALGPPPHTAVARESVSEPAAVEVIDLPTALQLAGADNLDLAIVREGLAQARAADQAATLAFLPWVTVGASYDRRQGGIQDVTGIVREVDRSLEGQTAALAAEVDLGHALFQKLAARQVAAAARYSVAAQRADALFAAAEGYFVLVQATADEANAREALAVSQDYEAQLVRAADIGLANRSDALRVSVQSQRYEIALRQAQADKVSASARLAQVLRLDPAILLAPVDAVAPQITLVPLDTEVTALLEEARAARPEIAGSRAAVSAAEHSARDARYGPLIPRLSAQVATGELRGGPEGLPTDRRDYDDASVMLSWRVGPGGLFDTSRIAGADSRARQARLEDARLRQGVDAEVVDALARARAAADQAELAREGVALAERSLDLSLGRRQFGVAAVAEAIDAQEDLAEARADLIRATTDYARAQHALARAVGRIGR